MRKDAQLNLERVLTAAKQCFAEHGAAVTMDEVARRAGVGVGTLYRRFGNRAGLVEALYEEAVTQASDAGAALLGHTDPWEALALWCATYVDILATKRTLMSELTPLFERDRELADGPRRRAKVIFEQFLNRARDAGLAREDVEATDVMVLLDVTMGAGAMSSRLLSIVLAGIRIEIDET